MQKRGNALIYLTLATIMVVLITLGIYTSVKENAGINLGGNVNFAIERASFSNDIAKISLRNNGKKEILGFSVIFRNETDENMRLISGNLKSDNRTKSYSVEDYDIDDIKNITIIPMVKVNGKIIELVGNRQVYVIN